jgi:ATP-dependent 26S proteasome regulatory subunit
MIKQNKKKTTTTKDEIKEILKIYAKELQLESNVDLNKIAEMCDEFTGADIKSVVCDALIKAFHRAHDELTSKADALVDFASNKILKQESIKSLIKVNNEDFVSSITAIKTTIDKGERFKLKNLYLSN